jgi:Zn-dependent alcohol dehydrogenase
MTRRGGQAVIAGIAPPDLLLNISVSQEIVGAGRTIKGSWYGSSDVRRDIPRLIEYYRGGELKLDELVSRVIALEEINAALDHMETADAARAVIEY